MKLIQRRKLSSAQKSSSRTKDGESGTSGNICLVSFHFTHYVLAILRPPPQILDALHRGRPHLNKVSIFRCAAVFPDATKS